MFIPKENKGLTIKEAGTLYYPTMLAQKNFFQLVKALHISGSKIDTMSCFTKVRGKS